MTDKKKLFLQYLIDGYTELIFTYKLIQEYDGTDYSLKIAQLERDKDAIASQLND